MTPNATAFRRMGRGTAVRHHHPRLVFFFCFCFVFCFFFQHRNFQLKTLPHHDRAWCGHAWLYYFALPSPFYPIVFATTASCVLAFARSLEPTEHYIFRERIVNLPWQVVHHLAQLKQNKFENYNRHSKNRKNGGDLWVSKSSQTCFVGGTQPVVIHSSKHIIRHFKHGGFGTITT